MSIVGLIANVFVGVALAQPAPPPSSDFVSQCKAFQAENPAAATVDCGCLGEKVKEDPSLLADLGAMAAGAAPTEKAVAALTACPAKTATTD